MHYIVGIAKNNRLPAQLELWREAAGTLYEGLRARALNNTALAKASPNRIRRTLLRIGAVVIRNTRRIRVLMNRACPHQDLFRAIAFRLNSP